MYEFGDALTVGKRVTRLKEESDLHGDMIFLDIPENMNGGEMNGTLSPPTLHPQSWNDQ